MKKLTENKKRIFFIIKTNFTNENLDFLLNNNY